MSGLRRFFTRPILRSLAAIPTLLALTFAYSVCCGEGAADNKSSASSRPHKAKVWRETFFEWANEETPEIEMVSEEMLEDDAPRLSLSVLEMQNEATATLKTSKVAVVPRKALSVREMQKEEITLLPEDSKVAVALRKSLSVLEMQDEKISTLETSKVIIAPRKPTSILKNQVETSSPPETSKVVAAPRKALSDLEMQDEEISLQEAPQPLGTPAKAVTLTEIQEQKTSLQESPKPNAAPQKALSVLEMQEEEISLLDTPQELVVPRKVLLATSQIEPPATQQVQPPPAPLIEPPTPQQVVPPAPPQVAPPVAQQQVPQLSPPQSTAQQAKPTMKVEELWRDHPLKNVTATIKPTEGEVPEKISLSTFYDQETPLQPLDFSRTWFATTCEWDAPASRHQPLLFEEPNLERLGYTYRLGNFNCDYDDSRYASELLQPLISGGHFFGRIPLLPFMLLHQNELDTIYTLGIERPGSMVPYRSYRLRSL